MKDSRFKSRPNNRLSQIIFITFLSTSRKIPCHHLKVKTVSFHAYSFPLIHQRTHNSKPHSLSYRQHLLIQAIIPQIINHEEQEKRLVEGTTLQEVQQNWMDCCLIRNIWTVRQIRESTDLLVSVNHEEKEMLLD